MRLNIKVIPKAKREKLVKEDNMIKAYVKAAPEKGRANKAVIELVAREYGARKSDVVIVTGLTSRNKIVEVLER